MSYLKQIWRDFASGGTTLTADRLNHMEDGIAAANDAWDSVARATLTSATTADRWGHIVLLAMREQTVTITDSWGSHALGALPADMRPRETVTQPAVVENGSSTTAALRVDPGGSVSVINLGGTPVGTQHVSCTASWTT